jgi:hypothetical protein
MEQNDVEQRQVEIIGMVQRDGRSLPAGVVMVGAVPEYEE